MSVEVELATTLSPIPALDARTRRAQQAVMRATEVDSLVVLATHLSDRNKLSRPHPTVYPPYLSDTASSHGFHIITYNERSFL